MSKIIDEVYYDYLESDEFAAMPRPDELKSALEMSNKAVVAGSELEEIIANTEFQHQKFGFMLGMRYAARLFMEIFNDDQKRKMPCQSGNFDKGNETYLTKEVLN